MAYKGNPTPVRQHETRRLRLREQEGDEGEVEVVLGPAVYRPQEPIQLFDDKVISNTTEQVSDAVDCGPYRHFALYLDIDSTSTPTTLQIKVQFLDRWSGKWYTFKQGLFASLYYEDTDVASGVQEMFQGMCAGRAMRVTLTGVGTSSSAYFTVSVAVEFYN